MPLARRLIRDNLSSYGIISSLVAATAVVDAFRTRHVGKRKIITPNLPSGGYDNEHTFFVYCVV